jgi:hypothetical protein
VGSYLQISKFWWFWATFQLERKGPLMIYKTGRGKLFARKRSYLNKTGFLGLAVSELNDKNFNKLNPIYRSVQKVPFIMNLDGYMTPTEFMPKMMNHLVKAG